MLPRILGTNREDTFFRLAASYSAWVWAISDTPVHGGAHDDAGAEGVDLQVAHLQRLLGGGKGVLAEESQVLM